MPFDSTAELLFKINADPSDAQGNIQRFRAFFGKSLDDIRAETGAWSQKMFGNFSTVGGAMTAIAAVAAAGAASIGAALFAAGKKAADYALEIEEGTHRTGMAAEDLSRLRYVADMSDLSWQSLTLGLSRFASTIDAARDPTSKQAAELKRLGITQAEIEAGSRNMLPLLYRVSDAFHGDATGVEKAAIARQLFSRGGPAFIEMLSRGSEALKQMGVDAEHLGLVITEKDIQAAKAFQIELKYLKAEVQGLTLAIGKELVPALQMMAVGAEASVGGIRNVLAHWKEVLSSASLSMPAQLATTFAGYFAAGMGVAGEESIRRLKQYVQAAHALGEGLEAPGKKPGAAPAEAAREFWGLSSILEQVRGKLAGTQGDEAKLAEETEHLTREVSKAAAEFQRLQAAKKLDPESAKRELEALAALPGMITQYSNAALARINEATARAAEERTSRISAATEDLKQRIEQQEEDTYQHRLALWGQEVGALAARLKKEELLTAENQALVESLRREGTAKLQREQSEAFLAELREQQRALAEMVTANFTARERIAWTYQQDLVRFSAVELAKKMKFAATTYEVLVLTKVFADSQAAATKGYQTALTTLVNSTGWKGVFGNFFAQHIKGNEALLREWSTTANQAAMMVRVAFESVKEMGQEAFASMAQGMGQNIANAIVYKESVGAAMKAALAATLESIAAECYVQAIYSTALGFLRLAQWDFASAANAFTAAGIFGGVGTAAAIAGRAVAPAKAGAGGTAAASSGGSSETASAYGSTGSGGSQSKGNVTVNVFGCIVGRTGIEEFAEIINDAVQNRDVRLISTQVKRGGKVGV